MLLAKSPVAFARVALSVCREKLPKRRSKHSRRDFEWPQLVACLLLRGFCRLDYRGLEILLTEHDALRRALELERVPDHTGMCRAMGHLRVDEVDALMDETVRRLSPLPPSRPQGRHRGRRRLPGVALDGTGLRWDNASRSYFALLQKNPRTRRWPKWSIAVDVDQHFVLSQVAARGPRSDHCEIDALVDAAQRRRRSHTLFADSGFDSERVLRDCRDRWKLRPVIRIKPRGRAGRLVVRSPLRRRLYEDFPERLYRRRKQVESTFSAHKRRFGDVLRSRIGRRRHLEALLRGVLHNCAVLDPVTARTSQQSYTESARSRLVVGGVARRSGKNSRR